MALAAIGFVLLGIVLNSLASPILLKRQSDSSSSAPRLADLGATVSFASRYYYVMPNASASAFIASGSGPAAWTSSYFPLTVLVANSSSSSASAVTSALSSFAADDVYAPDFLSTLVVRNSGNASVAFDSSLTGATNASTLATTGYSGSPLSLNFTAGLPSGPYMATFIDGRLDVYRVLRLYADVQQAFFYGTYQRDDGTFAALSASVPDTNGVAAVGVPSRLYYTATENKPLAGIRVSVKDLYNVAGLKTSMGNRAWESLYPAVNTTAPSIQRLIDLGAVIIGKTRLSQFANGEYGTADNVDYHTPFNARGDGYQDPSSSSSGPGAASGAYSWIDMDVGSDTGGSVRAPAGVNGAFGNRPSQGAIGLDGVLPLSPLMDTAAFLSQDAYLFAKLGRAWYGANQTLAGNRLGNITSLNYLVDPPKGTYNNTPSPGFFPSSNPEAAPIYEQFVAGLEGYLKLNRTVVDFFTLFNRTFGNIPPAVVGPAWTLLTSYDQWNLVGKQFFTDYQQAHDGDNPFADAPILLDWQYGNNVTAAERQYWYEQKVRFQGFMASTQLPNCSTLNVFPLVTGLPSYKSDYHAAPTPETLYNGTNRYTLSQLGGVPEVVLPIGQVPYLSKITNTTKYLPVSVSLQSGGGCDFVLYDLVEKLADVGVVNKTVISGPLTFPM